MRANPHSRQVKHWCLQQHQQYGRAVQQLETSHVCCTYCLHCVHLKGTANEAALASLVSVTYVMAGRCGYCRTMCMHHKIGHSVEHCNSNCTKCTKRVNAQPQQAGMLAAATVANSGNDDCSLSSLQKHSCQLLPSVCACVNPCSTAGHAVTGAGRSCMRFIQQQ